MAAEPATPKRPAKPAADSSSAGPRTGFALLQTPSSQPQPSNPQPSQPQPSGVELAKFLIGEFHGFFGYLKEAVEQYGGEGQVPQTIFKRQPEDTGKKVRGINKDGRPRAPRAPSVYNIYVKQKIEELKADGFKAASSDRHDGLFAKAVESWRKLSDEERSAFTKGIKQEALEAETGLIVPQQEAVPAAETEKKKKKKRKKESMNGAPDGIGSNGTLSEGELLKKKKKKKKHRSDAE